jgi:hypothetical protein
MERIENGYGHKSTLLRRFDSRHRFSIEVSEPIDAHEESNGQGSKVHYSHQMIWVLYDAIQYIRRFHVVQPCRSN